MTLENVNFGDLSLGFTWLLRLKPQPNSYQAFLENFDCDSATNGAIFAENFQNRIQLFLRIEHKISVRVSLPNLGANIMIVTVVHLKYWLISGLSFQSEQNCQTLRQVEEFDVLERHLGRCAVELGSLTCECHVDCLPLWCLTVDQICFTGILIVTHHPHALKLGAQSLIQFVAQIHEFDGFVTGVLSAAVLCVMCTACCSIDQVAHGLVVKHRALASV
jgi:hypothetical protein